MTTDLNSAIVRIRTKQGMIMGAGFLVDEGKILTCAHVVRDALGLKSTENKPAEPVHIDFPFIPDMPIQQAIVAVWKPSDKHGGDIAGLELVAPLPKAVKPVRLVTLDRFWERTFRAFGFPKRRSDGRWAEGKMLDVRPKGWVQLELS